jgi:hypothetical protein
MRQTDGMEKYNPRTSASGYGRREESKQPNRDGGMVSSLPQLASTHTARCSLLTARCSMWSLFRAVYVRFQLY